MSDLELLKSLGYARVKDAFAPADLKAVDRETGALIESWMSGEAADPRFWTWQPPDRTSPVLYRIHDLEHLSPAVAALITEGALPHLAEVVLGTACKPTACALTLKLAGCGLAVPWHRDPIEAAPQSVYNFSIYLDRSDATNGALHVVPASHLQPELRWSGESSPPGAVCVEADPADVLIHDVRLLHGSPACRKNTQRRAIVVEYQREESTGMLLGAA